MELTVEEGVQAIVTSGAAIDPRIEGTGAGEMNPIAGRDLLTAADIEDSLPHGDLLEGEGLLPDEGEEGEEG